MDLLGKLSELPPLPGCPAYAPWMDLHLPWGNRQCRHQVCFEGYLYLAMYYEAMEDYPRAIEYYEKSLEANPHGITARATLEHLRKKMGKKNG